MQMIPSRKPVIRVILFTGIAAGAIVVACSPRVASDLTGPGTKAVSATAAKLEAERMGPGTVYFESQVERPVAQAPGSTGPKYPADLKAQLVEGRVLAMFVVNEDGLAEISTLKVLKADNPAFAESVREALPGMRFEAAEIGGRKVKQMVQQPFMFALSEAGKKPSAVSGEYIERRLAPGGKDARIVPAASGVVRAPTVKSGSTPLTVGDTKFVSRTPQPHIKGQPYFESQVEQPVGVAASFRGPEYPADLKSKRIEGTVLAMFVVNEDGLADMSSFKVLQGKEPAFEASVRAAVAAGRFTPALIGGVAVKQLVQQPFAFSLSR